MHIAWEPPEEPNGVISGYEVSFRIDGGVRLGSMVDWNTTTFDINIEKVPPGGIITNITLIAHTEAGFGEATSVPDVVILQDREYSLRLHGCCIELPKLCIGIYLQPEPTTRTKFGDSNLSDKPQPELFETHVLTCQPPNGD